MAKKQKFNRGKEVRAIARERVGSPPASRPIQERPNRKKPKHRKPIDPAGE
jgi:hypothetical protein